MKRPEFFLIGAPKSGTTALYEYLRNHPSIFLCEKDLNFFSEDISGMRRVRAVDEYLELFAGAHDEHLAVGEASSLYLFSSVATQRIREFDSEAKLIALLRNPIDLVYSFHGQLLYSGQEDVEDFESAWALQEERSAGRSIPRRCTAPGQLQYRKIAALGTQIQRLTKQFPVAQLSLHLHDDFVRDPGVVYEDVLGFLGVPSDNRTDFPRINAAKSHRIEAVGAFTEQPPPFIRKTARFVKKIFRIDELGLLNRLRALNDAEHSRPPLDPAFRNHLREIFRPEIDLMSNILKCNLSDWSRPPQNQEESKR